MWLFGWISGLLTVIAKIIDRLPTRGQREESNARKEWWEARGRINRAFGVDRHGPGTWWVRSHHTAGSADGR